MNALPSLNDGSILAPDLVRAAIDRSFLDSVKTRFSGWGITPETLEIVAWTLACAVVLGTLVFLLNTFVLNRRRGFLPTGTVTDPAEIDRLFDLAIAQRSKVEMSFSSSEDLRQVAHCSIEEVREGHMELEITAKVNAGPSWLKRRVSGYMRVTPPKKPGQAHFYHFTTTIAGVSKREDGSVLVTLVLPTALKLQQKRVHLRLEPPTEYMLGIALWPAVHDKTGALETDVKEWGKPPLLAHAGKKDMMRVANVSAGGMRLDVNRTAASKAGLEFAPGERFFVLADIYDPDKQSKERLWCVVRVQNRFADHQDKKIEVGVKFVAQGYSAGEDAKKSDLAWRKVGKDGIDAIGNWVVKRHLESFRKTSAL